MHVYHCLLWVYNHPYSLLSYITSRHRLRRSGRWACGWSTLCVLCTPLKPLDEFMFYVRSFMKWVRLVVVQSHGHLPISPNGLAHGSCWIFAPLSGESTCKLSPKNMNIHPNRRRVSEKSHHPSRMVRRCYRDWKSYGLARRLQRNKLFRPQHTTTQHEPCVYFLGSM